MRFLSSLKYFDKVVALDFEYTQPDGELPDPICCVAKELRTGVVYRLTGDDLRRGPPGFLGGPRTLVVSYFASAEIGCFLELGWGVPTHILDLYVEFRWLTNGLLLPAGRGLLGALLFYGLPALTVVEKAEMRELAMRGGPYEIGELQALVRYCESDVVALELLFGTTEGLLDVPRALLRGRYMGAVAAMERHGTPLDAPLFRLLAQQWERIEEGLIERMDPAGLWEGRSFRYAAFEDFLRQRAIAWPRLDSGRLALDDQTFRTIGRRIPAIRQIADLRALLSAMRLRDMAIGADGRNRCKLSPFSSRTGRNQPSNKKYIFGPAAWLRSLIKPGPGRSLAYIDWAQQELGIAAALSGDLKLQEAYSGADPYIDFAVRAGLAPLGATKATHPIVREVCKVCCLGVLYGMGERALALSAGIDPIRAADLLRLHKEAYPVFWRWRNSAVDFAMLRGRLHSTFGWGLTVTHLTNPRSLANFPMQANGAEMLRIAICKVQDAGIAVCGPVHDAILVEAQTIDLPAMVKECQAAMEKASKIVLGGFPLRTETDVVTYPERYRDKRGADTWETIMRLLMELDPSQTRAALGVTESNRYLSGGVTPG
jgi:DNA polymerase I